MKIDEIMTRQMIIDASQVTAEEWAGWSTLERAYATVNSVGDFRRELADQVDWARFMMSPGTRAFLEVSP